ncbi:receptor-like protein 9DC3 [Capsicum annuum]|uniref:receptor-like protein 9DC3 n=1 Tax=Capsicum annuum TaxID=4072 RepID=UPI001FB05D92|nr:receptor-like protein 9DC3 [Capsicum annuum]
MCRKVTFSWKKDTFWSGKVRVEGQMVVAEKARKPGGLIPAESSHLSKLYVLRIRANDRYGITLGPYNFELLLKNLTQLRELDLFFVNISSTIPLNFSSYLTTLRLPGTQLRGWKDSGVQVQTIVLRYSKLDRNKLKGKVPPSLINCRYLEFLDLGNNELNDTFPSWLGGLPYLRILSLRSNKFHGPIKDSRTNNSFAQIRVIDLSSNGFSGKLPGSLFENCQAMKISGENSGTPEYVADIYSSHISLIVTTKGLDLELPRVLTTYMIIDLSRNRFEGHIPASFHQLSVLESLDLSSNKIGSKIPQQLVSLTFLAFLNLSDNHLVGFIPKGKQFDTFENSSYQGNDGLHGLPLSNDFGGDDGVPQATTPVELDDEEEEEEEGDLISWQAVLVGFSCGLDEISTSFSTSCGRMKTVAQKSLTTNNTAFITCNLLA